jgi:uncharacterized SAM-binding protein YcdF (DUF218 family)
MKTLALILVALLIWGAGLFAFGARVAGSTPAPDPQPADGVVALTGASTLRIEAAVQLLEDGKARRLLVSGVNPDVTRGELQAVAHDFGRAFSCCVDLGFEAANTQGNARETAGWVRFHHYRSLIVVTADYHMPRALLELHAALGGVALQPYPVATASLNARRWWRTATGARRMSLEYCKYLAILGREGLRRLGGGKASPPAAEPPKARLPAASGAAGGLV